MNIVIIGVARTINVFFLRMGLMKLLEVALEREALIPIFFFGCF